MDAPRIPGRKTHVQRFHLWHIHPPRQCAVQAMELHEKYFEFHALISLPLWHSQIILYQRRFRDQKNATKVSSGWSIDPDELVHDGSVCRSCKYCYCSSRSISAAVHSMIHRQPEQKQDDANGGNSADQDRCEFCREQRDHPDIPRNTNNRKHVWWVQQYELTFDVHGSKYFQISGLQHSQCRSLEHQKLLDRFIHQTILAHSILCTTLDTDRRQSDQNI